MDIFSITQYLRYILISGHRNGHGIHSPFIYKIVSDVFRNKIDPHIVLNIEQIRKRLIAHKRSITVNDLGAGSKKMKSGNRKVSEIAKYSAIPSKYGKLLSNMAGFFGEPYIIELGTSLGISTMYMASSTSSEIITVEGSKSLSEIALDNFVENGFRNIRLLNCSFEESFNLLEKQPVSPGLVFIDGSHRKEPTLKYFKKIADISDEKSVVIIDDIHYSYEMAEAWKIIKNFRNVSATIDIFRMGIVFFKKGVNKIDYVVRY